MPTFKRLVGRAAIVGVIWAASVPAAELAFRAMGYAPMPEAAGFFEAFGDRQYKHAPNAHARQDWAFNTFYINTDNLGFRCGEDGVGATNGRRPDVLIVGDSQALGLGVDYEQSVVGNLQLAADPAKRLIGNMAIGGHYLKNQVLLAKLLHKQHGLRADTVVLLVTPRMIAIPDGDSTSEVVDGEIWVSKPTLKGRVKQWCKEHIVLYQILRDAHMTLVTNQKQVAMYIPFYQTKRDEPAHVALLREQIESLKAWADSIDAKLVIVFLPLAIEFDLAAQKAAGDPEAADLFPDLPFNRLVESTDSLGVPVISMKPVMAELAPQVERLTLVGDMHYNADTSRRVGRAIWDELRRRDLIADP